MILLEIGSGLAQEKVSAFNSLLESDSMYEWDSYGQQLMFHIWESGELKKGVEDIVQQHLNLSSS